MPSGSISKEHLQTSLIDFYILSQGVPVQFKQQQTFQQVRLKIINAWKRTLLRDIEFCIACEARHIADKIARPINCDWSTWFQTQFGEVGGAWYTRWKSALKHAPLIDPDEPADIDMLEDVTYVIQKNEGNSKSRIGSYIAGKTAERELGLSLIEVCTRLFDPKLVHWHGGFGGNAWKRITDTLFHLWYATDLTEIVQLIDTCFALHHNTNIVFNKNIIWSHNGYGWIQQWLDYKWAAYSPISLLGFASPLLQMLVAQTGFNMGSDLPPSALEKRTDEFQQGKVVVLDEDGEKRNAEIKTVQGDYFKSIVLIAPHYNIQKTFGKHTKMLNVRIYSQEEFLDRFVEFEKKLEVHVDMATGPDKSVMIEFPKMQEIYAEKIQTAKPMIVTVYEEILTQVMAKGYTLGHLLEGTNLIRFRLKQHPKPLRFYFLMTASGFEGRVGYTDEENFELSKKFISFKKEPETLKLLSAVQACVDKHLADGE